MGNYGPEGSSGTNLPTKSSYEFVVSENEYRAKYRETAAGTAKRIFGENSKSTLLGIADGTSNTLALGEQTFDTHNGRTGSWAYRSFLQYGIDPNGAYNTTTPARGLNVWKYSTAAEKPGTRASWYSSASHHTGGVNFVMADGSVRFIRDSIAFQTLESLCTMSGGEVIADDN